MIDQNTPPRPKDHPMYGDHQYSPTRAEPKPEDWVKEPAKDVRPLDFIYSRDTDQEYLVITWHPFRYVVIIESRADRSLHSFDPDEISSGFYMKKTHERR